MPTKQIVLLGAGASVEAGVPASFDMTKTLVEKLGDKRRWVAEPLNFVCGALMAYDSAGGASPYAGLDIERVFAAVQLLAERRTLEVTPFVAAWHPAVDAHDQAGDLPGFFDRDLQKAVLGTGHSNGARDLIVKLVRSLTTNVGDGRKYETLAREMVTVLRGLVQVDPAAVSYLKPLVERGLRPGGVTIATLNYDLSVELAANAAGVPCYTGLSNWEKRGKWKWPTAGVRLLKLHGSISWCWDESRQVGEMAQRLVVETPDPEGEHREPALVFGQRGKLRPDGPFLSLLAEFESELTTADQLLVVGYSFRDEHVNEVIRRWTLEDSSRTIQIVDPSFSPEFRSFGWELLHSLNPGFPTPPPPPRVSVQERRASEAFADLSAVMP